ncbi:MAG: hypothetical protein ACQEQS_05915 [Thermodesulfobacteriota bacterium]
MNEFLKNLRSQQQDKFAGSYRSHTDKSNYPHPERRAGGDRRGHSSSKGNINLDQLTKKVTELVPELKNLMQGITDTADRMADIMERYVAVEEKRNDIFESMEKSIQNMGVQNTASENNNENDVREQKTKKIPKEEKNRIMDLIISMRDKGSTYDQIAEHLGEENIPTFSNKGHWHAQTIHRLYQQRKKELSK